MKKLLIYLISAATLFITGCENSDKYQAKAYELSNQVAELKENIEEKEAIISELEQKDEYEEVSEEVAEETVEEVEEEEAVTVAAEPTRSEIEQDMLALLELDYYIAEFDSASKTFTIVANGLWADDIHMDIIDRADSQWFKDILNSLNNRAYHIYENLGAGYTVNLFGLDGELLAVNIDGQPVYDYLTISWNFWALNREIAHSPNLDNDDFTRFEEKYEKFEEAKKQHLQGNSYALINFTSLARTFGQ